MKILLCLTETRGFCAGGCYQTIGNEQKEIILSGERRIYYLFSISPIQPIILLCEGNVFAVSVEVKVKLISSEAKD